MDSLQLSGTELVKLSDYDLGMWLVASWLAFQAEKAGIARNAISKEWALGIVEASAAMDSDSVENAALESMFRKACGGDPWAAGRMLRSYLWDGAETMVVEKYADAGIKQARGRMKGGKKSAEAKQSDVASWHAKCAEKARALLQQGKAPRELAGILAPIFNVTPTAIRTVLKEAKVK